MCVEGRGICVCVEGRGFVCVEGRGICVCVEGRGICMYVEGMGICVCIEGRGIFVRGNVLYEITLGTGIKLTLTFNLASPL